MGHAARTDFEVRGDGDAEGLLRTAYLELSQAVDDLVWASNAQSEAPQLRERLVRAQALLAHANQLQQQGFRLLHAQALSFPKSAVHRRGLAAWILGAAFSARRLNALTMELRVLRAHLAGAMIHMGARPSLDDARKSIP